jgi:glycosyltransferase involved in cell wall biosynthesis
MNHVRNAKWMQERGHDVCFFCVEGSPIAKYALEQGVPVYSIEPHKKYYDFKKAKILADHLSSKNYTHLLIRSNEDMSITAIVKRKLGNKISTAYFMEMQLGVKKTNLLHTIRYKYIDLWSCPLNWLAGQVETMTNFRNQLVVIPSGMDLSSFNLQLSSAEARRELDLPEDSLLFGLIGRFDPQKGQLLLVEALEKAENKDFKIVLLGEPTLNEGDEYYNQLKERIDSPELQDRVFIRPFMKDVSIFFRAVDWFVMATKAETFGMVTIESLACGTPVIGSNAGGTPEILTGGSQEAGVLFETLNSADLASKIDRICKDNIRFDENDLQELAKKYDHHQVCEKVEEALELTGS